MANIGDERKPEMEDDFDDDLESGFVRCFDCNGTGLTMEGWDCEECDGTGELEL